MAIDRMEAIYDQKESHREIPMSSGRHLQFSSYLLDDGTLVRLIRDVTVQRKQKAEIELRQLELEQLSAGKDELFALIAHDLRSPLSAVLGFAELIERIFDQDMDQAKLRDYTKNLANGTRDLTVLVENLLDWAKLQMGGHQFSPTVFSLSEAGESAMQSLSFAAQKKDISISLDLPSTRIRADINMLRTILRNIINNAIKYVHSGGSISVNSVEHSDGRLEISVSDDGVGMSDEVIAKIQNGLIVKSTRGTSHETGSGLGLRICNRFIAAHDSELRIESKLGKGSTFRFTLPKA